MVVSIRKLILFSVLASTTAWGNSELTKEKLLEGCQIPEKRKMPLSSKISPCEDFHGYVCSEVENNFKLPEDRSMWFFSFSDAAEKILCAQKKYFSFIQSGVEPKTLRMQPAKNLYLSCMNEKSSAENEKVFIQQQLEILSKIQDKKAMFDFLETRMESPIGSFVSYGNIANQVNPSVNDIMFDADTKLFPDSTYLANKPLMADWEKLLNSFFITLGFDQTAQRAKWVVQYEKGIQRVYPAPAEARELFSKDTYQSRQHFDRYKQLQLSKFINKVPQNLKIRDIVSVSLLFTDNWLKNASLEEIKSVYLYYKLRRYLDDGFKDYYNESYAFGVKHFGYSSTRPERQERCTELVNRYYSMEFDTEMIEILFPNFPRNKVELVAEKIKKSMLNGIEKSEWLQKSTKLEAQNKVKKAALFLVKPKNEIDWNYTKSLELDATKVVDNKLKLIAAYKEKEWDELNKERIKSIWDMNPLALNAYYSPVDNKFVLLQGILQFPFFSEAYTETENLGAIGSVIGHELGHGIDDQGSAFDGDGKLRNWFTEKDMQEFKKRAELLVKQFDHMGHNGKLTLGENIGDNVGLTFAYQAAFPDASKGEMSDKKKFFESYARVWCGVMKPKFKEMLLKSDPHALGDARINGQVIHQGGFQEAYQCKKGDKMYLEPKERIKIW